MKNLIIFCILCLSFGSYAQEQYVPKVDLVLSLIYPKTNVQSIRINIESKWGPKQIQLKDIQSISYQNYCLIFAEPSGYYGAIDILGNKTTFKYKSADKLLSSKEWARRSAFISTHQEEYAKRDAALRRETMKQNFNRMLAYLRKSRASKYTESVSMVRGTAQLKRIKMGNKFGIVDSDNNLLFGIRYNDIKLTEYDHDYDKASKTRYSLNNVRQPYNRLFPVKEEGNSKNYSFVDYIGGYIWKNADIEVSTKLCNNTGEGKDCYLFNYRGKTETYYYNGDQRSVDLNKFFTHYVTLNMEQWGKKDEFESLSEYELRQSPLYTKWAMEYYSRCAVMLYTQLYPDINPFELCNYDRDNETFLIKSKIGNIAISVPFESSMQFKNDWIQNKVKCQDASFHATGQDISLAGITFGKFSGTSLTNYHSYDIENNDEKIIVRIKENSSTEIIPSDVDINIPQTYTKKERTFAVIISNENYTKLASVPYALNDGKIFSEYCQKTLGIPASNIRLYKNATYGVMLEAMKDIRELAEVSQGNIQVLFYYSGHGAPKEGTKEAYLLPIDAYGVQSEVCYPLARLYKELNDLNASSVTVFLDACFCGSARDGNMLASTRGVAIKPQTESPLGNMIVFSASSEDETALPYTEKGHGLFTYFLLKKLQATKGIVTLGELREYIWTNVRERSKMVNDKIQTPTVETGPTLTPNWRMLKL